MINHVYLAIPKECRVWCCGHSESISGKTLKMQRAEIQEAIALIHYLQRQKVNKDSMSLHILKFSNQSKGGAAVRALASHQCGLGSNPGVDAICGLSLLLVLSLAINVFLWVLRFSHSLKTTFFANSNSTRNQVDKEPPYGCATFKSLFIYLFTQTISHHFFFSV